MAKLNRERKLIERRQEKQVRKDARKRAAQDPDSPSDPLTRDDELGQPGQAASSPLL